MDKKKMQELYSHVLEQIKIATAKEQIERAQGNTENWETGRRLAYADVARRLVDIGCRHEPE